MYSDGLRALPPNQLGLRIDMFSARGLTEDEGGREGAGEHQG